MKFVLTEVRKEELKYKLESQIKWLQSDFIDHDDLEMTKMLVLIRGTTHPWSGIQCGRSTFNEANS